MEREARYNYVLGGFKSDVLFVFPQDTLSLDALLTDTSTYPGQSSRILANPGDPLWVLALIPGWEHKKIRANSYESWRNSSASSSNKPSQRLSNILPKPSQNHVKTIPKPFYTPPNILPKLFQNLLGSVLKPLGVHGTPFWEFRAILGARSATGATLGAETWSVGAPWVPPGLPFGWLLGANLSAKAASKGKQNPNKKKTKNNRKWDPQGCRNWGKMDLKIVETSYEQSIVCLLNDCSFLFLTLRLLSKYPKIV